MLQLLTPSAQLLTPKLLQSSSSLATRCCTPPRALSVRAAHQTRSATQAIASLASEGSQPLNQEPWSASPTATQAATPRLPVVALFSTLQCELVSSCLENLIAVWGLPPQSKRNLDSSGTQPLRDGWSVLYHRLLSALPEAAFETGLDAAQLLWHHGDPRYLGNCQGLLQHAEQEGGTLTRSQVRAWIDRQCQQQGDKWLEQNLGLDLAGFNHALRKVHAIDTIIPHAMLELARQQLGGELTRENTREWLKGLRQQHGDTWLEQNLGLSRAEYQRCAIDHVLPDAKGGLDHPRNYYLLSRSKNSAFGARISIEKCRTVGLAVVVAVLEAHRHALATA